MRTYQEFLHKMGDIELSDRFGSCQYYPIQVMVELMHEMEKDGIPEKQVAEYFGYKLTRRDEPKVSNKEQVTMMQAIIQQIFIESVDFDPREYPWWEGDYHGDKMHYYIRRKGIEIVRTPEDTKIIPWAELNEADQKEHQEALKEAETFISHIELGEASVEDYIQAYINQTRDYAYDLWCIQYDLINFIGLFLDLELIPDQKTIVQDSLPTGMPKWNQEIADTSNTPTAVVIWLMDKLCPGIDYYGYDT